MKKILNILSVLLLGFSLSLMAVGQETVLPVARPLQAIDASHDQDGRVRDAQQAAVVRTALVILQRIAQKARDENSPLAPELDNIVRIFQEIIGTGTLRPTAQPHSSLQYTAKESLNTEREKAYVQLARQYFYVFTTSPVEVPTVSESGEEARVEIVPAKSKRDEILDSFTACMKKISPAAQINLIQELIHSSHTNEELKLLEGLLDEVCVEPAGN